jgi:hypothetical protein
LVGKDITFFSSKHGEPKRIQIFIQSTAAVNYVTGSLESSKQGVSLTGEAHMTRGNLIKLCIIDVSNVVFNGPSARKEIESVPLTKNTLGSCKYDLENDIKSELCFPV